MITSQIRIILVFVLLIIFHFIIKENYEIKYNNTDEIFNSIILENYLNK